MTTRAKLFSQLARQVDTSGALNTTALNGSLGVTVYDTANELPTSGYSAGDQAFVKSTSRLYINSGVGWYNVAVINNTPNIASILDSDSGTTPFSLAADGTATTITITATDSDGDALTYSAAADSDFGGLATVSQADNVFTITPFSQDSATTASGTITFSVTDGINIANSGIQTFTLNFASALWDETLLSVGTSSTNGLHNSTFVDRSTNAHTVTTAGSPTQTSFHPYLDNWSVYFDGANDTTTELVYNLDSAINMGSDDYTVEVWCKATVSENRDGIFNFKSDGINAYYFMFRHAVAADTWEIYFSGGYSYTVTHASSSSPVGNWVHHAFVRQNGTFKWYIDGVEKLELTAVETVGLTWDTVDVLEVGKYSGGKWPGWISNLRVVKGDALYTANNFTVPDESLEVTSNTILLLASSNNYENKGSLGTSYTVGGTILPNVSAHNPFGQESEYAVGQNNGSVYLNGSSSVDGGASINPSSGCCIEGWAYVTAVSSYGFFFSTEQGNSGFYPRWYVGHDNSGNWRVSPGDATDNNLTSYPLVKNQWNHWALTNDGSTSRFFANGKLIYTKSVTPTGELLNFNISKYGDALQYTTYGYISDFRAATTIPTAYQTSSTTLDTQVFTPPSSPGGISGAGYYLPMDNAGIFDKTGNSKIIRAAGTASTSSTQTKYSATSLYFDGNTHYEADPITVQDFTFETWFYPPSGQSLFDMLNIGNSNSVATEGIGFYFASGFMRIWVGSSAINVSATLNYDNFNHVAYTREGNTLRAFLNGVLLQTITSVTHKFTGTVYIGAYYNNGIQRRLVSGCYHENLQILNYAKYTANFTPPTQTQGIIYQAES